MFPRWNGRCHRCGEKSGSHIMSMYNTQWLCMKCKEEEKNRSDYHLAEAKDLRGYAERLRSKGMPAQADSVELVAKSLERKDDK